jgi:hypothetical protein
VLFARLVLVDLIGQMPELALQLLDQRQAAASARGLSSVAVNSTDHTVAKRFLGASESAAASSPPASRASLPRAAASSRTAARSRSVHAAVAIDSAGWSYAASSGHTSSACSTLVARTPASSASSNSTRRSQTTSSQTRS